jgi:hypothetical protein
MDQRNWLVISREQNTFTTSAGQMERELELSSASKWFDGHGNDGEIKETAKGIVWDI